MFDITDISYYDTVNSGTVVYGYSSPYTIIDLITEFWDSSVPRYHPVFKTGTPNIYDLPTSGLAPTNIAYTPVQTKFKFNYATELTSLSITYQSAGGIGITLYSPSGSSLAIDSGVLGSSYRVSSISSSYDCYGISQTQYTVTYVFPSFEVDYIMFGVGGFCYPQEMPRVINKIESDVAPGIPVEPYFWTNFKDQTETR